jgi:GNAT superfamily N-acetyltransferase
MTFITFLAEYENLAHKVEINLDILKYALSGLRPRLEAHLASVDGEDVGFTTFFETFGTFAGTPKLYLEDIFVLPGYRKQGVGKALFAAFADEAWKRGCQRIEWQVLGWNETAIDFYKSRGAMCNTEWQNYFLEK